MLRDEKGHFLPGQQPPAMIRSSEQAAAMARRKHELAAIAARKALAQKAEERGVQRSPIAAVGLLAGKAYDAAIAGFDGDHVILADGAEYDKPDRRGAVEAGKFALRLADMLPADERAQAMPPSGGALLLSADAVASVVAMLERMSARRANE